MEVKVATWAALALVSFTIVIRWVWSLLDSTWFKPKKLERYLRKQGLKGNPYRFLYGDLKEKAALLAEASSKPMDLSHDIVPRLTPFDDRSLKTHGKDSFVWIGTSPMVNIMSPEDVKVVLTKMDDFRKPEATNPLIKLLVQGLAAYNGEKWVKHRRIINPAFHVEKLKETQLAKFSLPAGVQVALPTLLVHHDKELWGEDANEFKPERFSKGVSMATKNQLSFFPFGAGPWICVGQNFAMIESKLALALILQHFTFELSPSYMHALSSLVIIQPQYGAAIILHKC